MHADLFFENLSLLLLPCYRSLKLAYYAHLLLLKILDLLLIGLQLFQLPIFLDYALLLDVLSEIPFETPLLLNDLLFLLLD